MIRAFYFAVVFSYLALICSPAIAKDIPAKKVSKSLRRGVDYFRKHVSTEGGYLWRYAADFNQREGEIPASATTIWVQPPGTPFVGEAYLEVYNFTRDGYYLKAAQETGYALLQGQLQSGGWDYRIVFDSKERQGYAYRVDQKNSKIKKQRNVTTLDDNTTQAALSFLMRLDRALDFQDAKIHEAAQFALKSLLEAQYPNGAWPQRFSQPPNPADYPVKKASYPSDWSREYVKKDYRGHYTFNDNAIADMVELMFLAADIYNEPKYFSAAERAGDFILLAQMPEPQPGWAQQYSVDMHPVWARKFEPPAITGGEGQGVMQTLLRLYEQTGKKKYLAPLPRALDYYRNSQIADGQLARFYELKTNQPLYFTKDYQLTYSDADMPTHYGFKSGSRLDRITEEFTELKKNGPPAKKKSRNKKQRTPRLTDNLSAEVERIIQQQNEKGAWVVPAQERKRSNIPAGAPSIDCRTFVRNITLLARYLAAKTIKTKN